MKSRSLNLTKLTFLICLKLKEKAVKETPGMIINMKSHESKQTEI